MLFRSHSSPLVTSTSKFSVEDFEQVGTTSWEGVRNPEARNLMKEMLVGDKVHLVRKFVLQVFINTLQVLFYHSSCNNPGTSRRRELLVLEDV